MSNHGGKHQGTSDFLKSNQGKPDMAYLPWNIIELVAEIENHGAEKYERFNWQLGTPEAYLNAAIRHISSRTQDKHFDTEGHSPSGKRHLAHAILDLMFALWLDIRKENLSEQIQSRNGIYRGIDMASAPDIHTEHVINNKQGEQ